MKNFFPPNEISPLGEFLANCHFNAIGQVKFPIDPEIVASKYFGLNIAPRSQLMSLGVKSGIDSTQSTIFIDELIYMNEQLRYLSNQSIAHELGHAIFDVPLIRQMSATSIEDAFERHNILTQQSPGIEPRANILSGSFLVPRGHLIKQITLRLVKNYDRVVEMNPQLTMETVLSSMASSQLSRYFCQSDYVLSWRFKNEDIYSILKTTPDSPITELNMRHMAKLAEKTYRLAPISERIKALLPEDLVTLYSSQYA